MKVRRVSLSNVRSRRALAIELGDGLTVLCGPNGAGKTTVLEALALVLDGTPLRPGTPRDLIKDGESYLRMELELEDGPLMTAAAAYSRDGERRLTVDGAPLADASRWREALPVRSFMPDDLRLIKGSPRRRREYLDGLTTQRETGYADTLHRYEEALAQRNALLRAGRGMLDDDLFAPWEKILAQTGLAVTAHRESSLSSFIALFQAMYGDLSGDPPGALRLIYRTNVNETDESGYERKLAAMRQMDRQRTFTHLGPHRDDLRLIRNGLDMRDCASQGEQRAALLALVLSEWEYLSDAGPQPLLLLDDVMSELDDSRRRALVRVIRRHGQVVVTTTDLRYFTDDELNGTTVVELTSG